MIDTRDHETMLDDAKGISMDDLEADAVNHPAHYGGANNPYEAIKVIEAWKLNFNLGNTIKYIARAGKKDATIQELEKARWYLDREIQNLRTAGVSDPKS